MVFKIEFAPAAKYELFDALDYYYNINKELSERLYSEFNAGIDKISNNPFAFQLIYSDKRRCILKKFPYSIYFRIKTDFVEIISFFHHKRNPKNWENIE